MVRLPVTSSCTMFRPSTLAASESQRAATSPRVRSTRMLPSNIVIRWVSSGGTPVVEVLGEEVGVGGGPAVDDRVAGQLGPLPGPVAVPEQPGRSGLIGRAVLVEQLAGDV